MSEHDPNFIDGDPTGKVQTGSYIGAPGTPTGSRLDRYIHTPYELMDRIQSLSADKRIAVVAAWRAARSRVPGLSVSSFQEPYMTGDQPDSMGSTSAEPTLTQENLDD